jgi:fibronectin-binding autotransporter adhesin
VDDKKQINGLPQSGNFRQNSQPMPVFGVAQQPVSAPQPLQPGQIVLPQVNQATQANTQASINVVANPLSASSSPVLSNPPPTDRSPPKIRRPKSRRVWLKRGLIAALSLAIIGGGVLVLSKRGQLNNTVSSNVDANTRFDNIKLNLGELAKAGFANLSGTHNLSINGQLRVSDSIVLAPNVQPVSPLTGQLYYDQTANQLAYYNGSKFVDVGDASKGVVNSIGGLSGAITLGNGLAVVGGQLSSVSTGVSSLQGQTGNITFLAGNGISINGTTFTNNGVLSINGVNGPLTIANTTTAGSSITINNASNTAKGIASFSSANFSATSGVINTIQDIGPGASPTFAGLTLNGDANIATTSAYRIGGVVVCSGVVCTPASGSPFYIQNSATTQSNTNFAIQSASASSVGGLIKGASGQTADILDLQNSSGANMFSVSPTGATTVAGGLNVSAGGITVTGASTINGALGGLTGLTVTSGTVSLPNGSIADSALSANIAKLNTAQTFTAANTFKNSANSLTAFQIQNAAGTTAFNVDTTNNRVGIGNTTPAYPLDVTGDINTSTALRIGGVSICTASGCTNTGSSGSFIQNGTTLQTSANFAIQSAAVGSIGGLIKGASGQTADLLDLQNSTGTNQFSVSASGATASAGALTVSAGGAAITGNSTITGTLGGLTGLTVASGGATVTGNSTFKPTSNGITAFQIQNAAASTTVLDVDTTNNRIGIGNAAPAYALDVTGDINSSTALRVGGVSVCTASGCTSSGGSGNYIQNGTAVQASANFAIQSAAAGSVGALIRGAASQSADLLDLQNSSSVNQFSVTAGGAVTEAGALTVSAGGIAVTGNSTIAGTLGGLTGLTVASGGATVTGNSTITGTLGGLTGLTVASGGETITAGGLTVSAGGATVIGNTIFKPTSNGVTALQAQNALGTTTVLDVDTTNNRVGIGNAAPGYALDVTGDANVSGVYRIGGATVCTSSGCTAASGSNSYVQNGTTVQANTNFAIQSAAAGSVGGLIRGAASQSADLFDLQTSTPTTVFSVSSSGALLLQNSANSTAALQVQNAAGNQILAVDTTNSQAILGKASTLTGKLVFNGSGGTNTIALVGQNTPGANRTITLPDETGTVCTTASVCAGYGAGSGSGNYIQNGTTVQANANFAIQSAAVGNVGALIKGAASQTADLLELQNSAGTNLLKVGSTGSTLIQPSANSITAFQIQNAAASTTVFDADTTNGRIGIGNAAPGYALDVTGDANVSGVYRIGGTTICTSSGCTSSSGSGNYIQNGTTQQTANFNIVSAAAGSIGALIQGAASATTPVAVIRGGATPGAGGDLLSLQNSASTVLFKVGSDGTTAINIGTDSTSAFNLKNSASNNLFTIDSTNSRVGISLGSNATPAASLEVRGALRLSGTGNDTFVTPQSSSIVAKIDVPVYDPGTSGQFLALGLPAAAQTTARAISLFDNRAGAHQATIAVFTPDEANILGFSWDGSNTNGLVKSTTNNIFLQANTVNALSAINSSGAGRVGINMTSPNYTLDVTGDANVSGVYRIGGVTVCSGTTCTPASGSTNYIQNGTSVQASANFAIQSAAAGNVGALIKGAASQTADLLELQNSSGTNLFKVTSSGSVLAQPATNAATALQVQNAAGNTVFDTDTTNQRVGINTAAPGSLLHVGQSNLTPGTVTNSASSASVTGTSTTFTTSFQPGDTFTITSSGNTCIVQEVVNDTSLTCTATLAGSSSGSAYSFTQQTRLKVADSGTTTVAGNLYVTNPNSARMFGIFNDPSDNKFKIAVNNFGNTTTGSNGPDSGNSGQISASSFNSNSGGQISNIYVYFPVVAAGPNNHVKVAVYNDSAGTPGSLVSSATAPSTVATAATWTAVSLGGTYTLTANTTYWIGFNVDSNSTTYGNSGGTSKYVAMTYSSNFPANFSATGSGGVAYSVYAPYSTVTDQYLGKTALSVDDNGSVVLKALGRTDNAFNVIGATGTSLFDINSVSNTVSTTGSVGINVIDSTATLVVQNGSTQTYSLMLKNSSGTNVMTVANAGSAVYKNSANSTTAFQIQNAAASTTVLDADTTNGRIGIGNAAPAYALDVTGDINTSTVYRIGGTSICTASGCTSSSGSGSYIQNGTSVQASANFAIQSAAAGSVGAVIKGAASQTADLLDLQNSAATNQFSVTAGGAVTEAGALTVSAGGAAITGNSTIKPTSDGTTAFQLQNAAGTNLFTTDTTNERVYIGPIAGDTVGALLVLGNKTNAGDPTGVSGATYYNQNINKFRCYETYWHDCSPEPRTTYKYVNDLFTINNDSITAFNVSGAGAIQSGTAVGAVVGHPGIVQFQTGTSGVGAVQLGAADNGKSVLLGNGDSWRSETVYRIPVLSTVSQRFTVRAGFDNSASSDVDPTDGCIFKYSDNLNSGKFQGMCDSSSVATTCDTTVAAVANTWYRLTVVPNSAGTSVDFQVNGVSKCQVTTNIPTGATHQTSFGLKINQSAGLSSNTLDVDYISVEGQLGTSR